jgi:hypothetical protein
MVAADYHPHRSPAAVWEVFGDRPPIALARAGSLVYAAALTPDNRSVVAAHADRQVRVYDTRTGALARSFAGGPEMSSLAVAPDGATLAVGEAHRSVGLFDLATGRERHRLDAPAKHSRAGVVPLAFTPDGRRLLTGHSPPINNRGGVDGEPVDSLIVWDIASGQEVQRIRITGLRPDVIGDHHGIASIAVSPDGRLVATGGTDHTIRFTELATGRERRRFTGDGGAVLCVDFAPDGQRLASAESDGTALVWELYQAGPAELAEAGLSARWDDLAGDADIAHQAIGAFLNARDGVPFLVKHLPPDAAVPEKRMARLVGDLDGPRFAAREEAEKELSRLADLAAPALRRALGNNPSAEVRQRAEKLLKAMEAPVSNAELLRKLRAVEALEHAGTPAAREHLQALAGGAAGAELTRAAADALKRLEQK